MLLNAQRREHPERGVRRIRDDLRRHEGIEVSAETVRTVVNDAGPGNPPPQPRRRRPGIRRFERSCPNALWQIDIFTFQLKRMYPAYLVPHTHRHYKVLLLLGEGGMGEVYRAEDTRQDRESRPSQHALPRTQTLELPEAATRSGRSTS